MRDVVTTVYKYSELSESAQAKAREWWRDASARDNYFSESVIYDAGSVAAILGIEFKNARHTKGQPAVYWSGFWSQGDGASFHGRYSYAKGASRAIREYAPEDKELHRIADALQALQARYFYGLWAEITAGHLSNHYSHSNTMAVSVNHETREVSTEDEDSITRLMRDFADWIYRQLELAYEDQNSDEAIAETIEVNEYEFTEDGKRAV